MDSRNLEFMLKVQQELTFHSSVCLSKTLFRLVAILLLRVFFVLIIVVFFLCFLWRFLLEIFLSRFLNYSTANWPQIIESLQLNIYKSFISSWQIAISSYTFLMYFMISIWIMILQYHLIHSLREKPSGLVFYSRKILMQVLRKICRH